jgi:hypothetical protein
MNLAGANEGTPPERLYLGTLVRASGENLSRAAR